MRTPFDYQDDSKLRSAFTWVTKSGAGCYFNRPIGWYQIHQCAALDEIERLAGGPGTVRYSKDGVIEFRADGTQGFRVIGRAADIYRVADTKSR